MGIEPEDQTSREMKDKYGVFAYAVSLKQQTQNAKRVDYQVIIDGVPAEFGMAKLYVINFRNDGDGLEHHPQLCD